MLFRSITLDVRVAKKTLSEVPGPDEPLSLGSSSMEGSSSSTRPETILPAFGIRVEAFRVVLGTALLEEATPHLFVHGIRHCLRFLILDLPNVMDMVIFRTIFFELLVFFTFTLLTFHFAY